MPEWGRGQPARRQPSSTSLLMSSAARFGNPEDDKENVPPWWSRPKRSPLPSWYPRTSLRDITAISRALEKMRARKRELERLRMEQTEEISSPGDALGTELGDASDSGDVPLIPETRHSGLHISTSPETGSLTVTDCLETSDAGSMKENSTSLVVADSVAPRGPETPDIMADRISTDSGTPEAACLAEKSAGLVATCDRTLVDEAVAEEWWLKLGANTGNGGGIGGGFRAKKTNVLQHRSKVSLMR